LPAADEEQNLVVNQDASGIIDGSHFVVQYTRPIVATNDQDKTLINQNQNFIWAISTSKVQGSDPKGGFGGHNQAGEFTTNLLAADGTFPSRSSSISPSNSPTSSPTNKSNSAIVSNPFLSLIFDCISWILLCFAI
jgi:hypothetical protein